MEYNTKYSKKFKLECVIKYLNGEYEVGSIIEVKLTEAYMQGMKAIKF